MSGQCGRVRGKAPQMQVVNAVNIHFRHERRLDLLRIESLRRPFQQDVRRLGEEANGRPHHGRAMRIEMAGSARWMSHPMMTTPAVMAPSDPMASDARWRKAPRMFRLSPLRR